MAKSKKGGMAGRNHPKDENDTTAIWWTHSMRRRTVFPKGASIKVKFPDGATGGTWGSSAGVFTAFKNDKKVGAFESWVLAAGALSAEVKPDDQKANGQDREVAKDDAVPGTRRRRRLRAKVPANGDSAALTVTDVRGSGDDPTAILVGMAEDLEARARGFQLGAQSLRKAIQEL